MNSMLQTGTLDKPLLGPPVSKKLRQMRDSMVGPDAPGDDVPDPFTTHLNQEIERHGSPLNPHTGTFIGGKFRGQTMGQARQTIRDEFDANNGHPSRGLATGGLVTGADAVDERAAKDVANKRGSAEPMTRSSASKAALPSGGTGSGDTLDEFHNRFGARGAGPASATGGASSPTGMFGAGPDAAPQAVGAGTVTPGTDPNTGLATRALASPYGSGVGVETPITNERLHYLADETGDRTRDVGNALTGADSTPRSKVAGNIAVTPASASPMGAAPSGPAMAPQGSGRFGFSAPPLGDDAAAPAPSMSAPSGMALAGKNPSDPLAKAINPQPSLKPSSGGGEGLPADDDERAMRLAKARGVVGKS